MYSFHRGGLKNKDIENGYHVGRQTKKKYKYIVNPEAEVNIKNSPSHDNPGYDKSEPVYEDMNQNTSEKNKSTAL